MTKEELAEKLNGREYWDEMTDKEHKEASILGLVVVFGASDDLVEFRGAIYDEEGACDGREFPVTNEGLLKNECEEESCPYFEKLKDKATVIEALWCKEGDYSWTFKTKIPHATFDIMEENAKFCRGIVFALADVPDRK